MNSSIKEIPLTRVLLDILAKREGVNWYFLERFAPMHPDFVDFEFSVPALLEQFQREGLIIEQEQDDDSNLPIIRLTKKGNTLADILRQNRLQEPAIARIKFNRDKLAAPPRRRFAGKARIAGSSSLLPLIAEFFTPLDEQWAGIAMLGILGGVASNEILGAGTEFQWVDDLDDIIGHGRVSLPSKAKVDAEISDCEPDIQEPIRLRKAS